MTDKSYSVHNSLLLPAPRLGCCPMRSISVSVRVPLYPSISPSLLPAPASARAAGCTWIGFENPSFPPQPPRPIRRPEGGKERRGAQRRHLRAHVQPCKVAVTSAASPQGWRGGLAA